MLHEVGRSLVATLDIEQVLDAGVRNLARIVDCAAGAPRARDARRRGARGPRRVGPPAAAVGPPASRSPAEPTRRGAGARPARAGRDRGRAERSARRAGRLRAIPGRARVPRPAARRARPHHRRRRASSRRAGPRRFSAAEVERAAAIANQLAVAAENARLYEDLRRSYAELARAQRQLIQQERLAALGELSAVVAHEVRNPLGVIFNSLGSLRRLLRPSGDARMLLDIVGEEADRLNRIVGDLLDFARPSTPQLRPEPLERVVDEAVAAALAQNPPGVEVRRETDDGLPPVPIDARLVRQAVLNVAVNAVQAMPRGGPARRAAPARRRRPSRSRSRTPVPASPRRSATASSSRSSPRRRAARGSGSRW